MNQVVAGIALLGLLSVNLLTVGCESRASADEADAGVPGFVEVGQQYRVIGLAHSTSLHVLRTDVQGSPGWVQVLVLGGVVGYWSPTSPLYVVVPEGKSSLLKFEED